MPTHADAPGSAGGPYLDLEPEVAAGGSAAPDNYPRDPLSRALPARLAGPGGGTIRELCLELQSDEYGVGERSGLTNVEIEQLWEQRGRAWHAAGAAEAVPALLDVLPTDGDRPPRLPSTLYCREREAFFRTPCPACGAPLTTCRDDDWLIAAGLPPFTRSLDRFLACAACRAAGREARFYSLLPVPAQQRERGSVLEQRDLYRGFGSLARGGDALLPCVGCAGLEECYPADPAAAGRAPRVITPVTFYEAVCLPTERFPLAYETFAAVLGGAPLPEAPQGATAAFEQRYGQRRYLFEADPAGKLPLEILRLKLVLFAQLAAAVSRLQRATGAPHLALSPATAVVDLGAAAADVPRLYNFRTRVIGIAGALSRREVRHLPGDLLRVPLLEAPLGRDSAFAGSLAGEQVLPADGQLAMREVRDDGGRCAVTAELSCDSGALDQLGDKDLILASLSGRGVRVAVEIAGYGQVAEGGRVRLAGTAVGADADARALLGDLCGGQPVRATFTVLRCLHAPADLQALGLMLFTTLLSNREQGHATVTAAARRVSEQLVRRCRDEPSLTGDDLEDEALAALRRGATEGVFARRQVFDDPAAHPDPSASIADRYWFGALLLGVRALTQIPGFGLCRAHGDFDPAHPEGPADRLRVELGVLTQKIEAELLGRHGMRAVFAEALARVMRDSAPRAAAGSRR